MPRCEIFFGKIKKKLTVGLIQYLEEQHLSIIFFSWKVGTGEREESLGHAKLTCVGHESRGSKYHFSPISVLKTFCLIYVWSQAFEGTNAHFL